MAANLFKFADWITLESLRILVNKLEISHFMNTDYNKEFTKNYAIGDSLGVKLPQRFTIRDGLGYSAQALDRKTTTVSVDQIFGIDFDWDGVEHALKMERGDAAIRREYLEPAMAQLANEIDDRASLWCYRHTNNVVGVLGTNPTAFSTYLDARTRLVENACPPGKAGMIVTPGMMNTIVANNLALFHPNDEIAKAFKMGYYGHASGFDWYESNNLYSHTAGTWASGVTKNGASSDGDSTIALTATTNDTFLAYDTITIADVNNVNPKNRRSTGSLKHFLVKAAVTAAASAATLSISPTIFGPGNQYQNVDALPANGATVTLWPGTSSPNGKSGKLGLALTRDAFACVGVKMQMPTAVEISSQHRDPTSGIAVSFVRQFDIQDRKMKNRFDVLLGFGDLYADNCAVRIASST